MGFKIGNAVTLGATLVLIFAGCSRSQPVTDQVVLAAEQTQRGLVGYEEVDYVYPVRVPGSNRYVEMTSKEPLEQPPTYDDYLAWKAKQ